MGGYTHLRAGNTTAKPVYIETAQIETMPYTVHHAPEFAPPRRRRGSGPYAWVVRPGRPASVTPAAVKC